MKKITFSASFSFVGNRPFTDVKLNPTYSGSPTHKCLVDTGADFLQLPISAAAKAGLSMATATLYSVSTASGTVTLQRLNGVTVEIEGKAVTVPVLFDPTNTAPLLAGRGVLLSAFDIGMQPKAWHRT